MAKKDVTLRVEEWRALRDALGASGLPRDVESSVRQHRLWEVLDMAVNGATEAETTLGLLSAQRTMLIRVLQEPPIPWRTDAAPRIWKLMAALGYKLPEVEEPDDEEVDA